MRKPPGHNIPIPFQLPEIRVFKYRMEEMASPVVFISDLHRALA